jgi:hypothetical protein
MRKGCDPLPQFTTTTQAQIEVCSSTSSSSSSGWFVYSPMVLSPVNPK